MHKLSIRCVARSGAAAALFSERNGDFAEFIIGSESYFDVINSEISNLRYDYCLLLHDDVILPINFPTVAQDLIKRLNAEWPNWAIAGNAGVAAFKFGSHAENIVRFLEDPHGGPNLRGVDVPCATIDGNVMLLNTKAMREKGIEVPKWTGFQLYDIVLCLEALRGGCAVIAVPELTCFHLSGGDQKSFNEAVESQAFKNYLSRTIKVDYFISLNGIIRRQLCDWKKHSGSLDPVHAALVNASIERKKRTLSIVIRTQFRNADLLLRTLFSAAYFKASASLFLKVEIVLITDCKTPAGMDLSVADSVRYYNNCKADDTRFELVQLYSSECDAEFSWFIDDDDWLFPNVAEELALILNSVPSNSIVFCDSRVFNEAEIGDDDFRTSSTICTPGDRLPAENWSLSLSHENSTPFCGMIIPKVALDVFREKTYSCDGIFYYEDHFILISSMLACNLLPVVFDGISVGISVRTSQNTKLRNTITETDRTKWNKSSAQKFWALNNSKIGSPLYKIYSNTPMQSAVVQTARPPSKSFKRRALLSGVYFVLKNPTRYHTHVSRLSAAMKSEGVRGVKKYLRRSGKAKYQKVFGVED